VQSRFSSYTRAYFICKPAESFSVTNNEYPRLFLSQLSNFTKHLEGVGVHSKGKVKLTLCLTNYTLCQEGVWGSERIDSHFLDLGTSWR
jgi:hypothetical protein